MCLFPPAENAGAALTLHLWRADTLCSVLEVDSKTTHVTKVVDQVLNPAGTEQFMCACAHDHVGDRIREWAYVVACVRARISACVHASRMHRCLYCHMSVCVI